MPILFLSEVQGEQTARHGGDLPAPWVVHVRRKAWGQGLVMSVKVVVRFSEGLECILATLDTPRRIPTISKFHDELSRNAGASPDGSSSSTYPTAAAGALAVATRSPTVTSPGNSFPVLFPLALLLLNLGDESSEGLALALLEESDENLKCVSWSHWNHDEDTRWFVGKLCG